MPVGSIRKRARPLRSKRGRPGGEGADNEEKGATASVELVGRPIAVITLVSIPYLR